MLRRAISTVTHLHSTNEGSTFKVPCNKQIYVVERIFFVNKARRFMVMAPSNRRKWD